MINRGKLLIIPDEKQILQDVFERDVEVGKSHTYRLQEFSDLFKLGYKFNESDYQTVPCTITSLGHLVIKMEDDVSLVVCYLPETITNRQYDWLYQNINMLSQYVQVNGYSLQTLEENGSCWKKVHGAEEIKLEASKKNLLAKKGMKK